ncbi:hypothetical protein, partial [Staphylococcus aureus]|uniref:hypothetical protein n=1 Tax=Staphylococcus aureus TaxID=1280 RepID=UPI001C408239
SWIKAAPYIFFCGSMGPSKQLFRVLMTVMDKGSPLYLFLWQHGSIKAIIQGLNDLHSSKRNSSGFACTYFLHEKEC